MLCYAVISERLRMSQILEATFDGHVFRPIDSVELQPDTKVQLVVTVKTASDEEPVSFLRTARSLKLQGPKDWSARVDDYLYGEAKLDDERFFLTHPTPLPCQPNPTNITNALKN